MNREKFIEELKKIGIDITLKQEDQLAQYYNILIEENQKYNLTAITQKEEVYLKHFYDSLTLSKIVKLESQKICDIGSGAGFPGIVLKIIYPDIEIDLMDSTEKRCNFLKLVINKLDLKKINVITSRAEDYSKKTREKYDIVTARAVAPLPHLLEYSIPLVKVDGYFIAMKGKIDDELKNIKNYYEKLFIELESIEKFELPQNSGERNLLKFKKNKITPSKYPRSYKEIKKKNL